MLRSEVGKDGHYGRNGAGVPLLAGGSDPRGDLPACRVGHLFLSPCVVIISPAFGASGWEPAARSNHREAEIPSAVSLQAHDFGGEDDGGLEETSAASAFMSKLGMRTPPTQPRYIPPRQQSLSVALPRCMRA